MDVRPSRRAANPADPSVARRQCTCRVIPRERVHAITPACDQLGAGGVVGHDAVHLVGQGLLVRRLDEQRPRRPRPRGSNRPEPRPPALRPSLPPGAGSRSPRRSTDTRASVAVRGGRAARRRRPGPPARPALVIPAPALLTAASISGRAGPSCPAMTRRRSACRAPSAPNAPTRCAKFLRGSSVPIATTNGASPTAPATIGGISDSVAERRDAERYDHEAAGRPQSRVRRSPRSRRPRTPTRYATLLRARPLAG